MEAETSRYGPKQVGRCWVLGMQQNDLISKQSVLIFLVLGAYLRAILCIDAVYADPPVQSLLC